MFNCGKISTKSVSRIAQNKPARLSRKVCMTPRPNTDTGIHVSAPSYTSRFVEAGGLRLHYLDYGTAGLPAMLCVHGGAAHAHWFDFVAAGFCADHHVLALDQRGHGDSAWVEPPNYAYERFAGDLHEVVEKLDLNDFVLIGHSMGGTIALTYAATYPGRVNRLVIVDSTLHMTAERVAALREVGARQGSSSATHEEFVTRFRLRPAGTTAAIAMFTPRANPWTACPAGIASAFRRCSSKAN